MGGCGSNMIERLGPEFGKVVAVEKGKVLVDTKVKEFKDTLLRQTDQVKNQTLKNINDQEFNMLQKVKHTMADIDKQHPGTLDKAAAIQRIPKEQLLGSKDIQAKFKQLRVQTNNQFRKEYENMTHLVDQTAEQTKRNLETQRPQIPIFDSLKQDQRKKALQEGEKKFADQIKGQQDLIQKQLAQQLNLSKFTQMLNNAQKSVNLQGISKQSEGLIQAGKNGLTSTSLFC